MSGAEIFLTVAVALIALLLLALLVMQVVFARRLGSVLRPADRPVQVEHVFAPYQHADADTPEPYFGSVLRIELGDRPGACFQIRPNGSTWIGRDDSANDIIIASSSVSRRHGRIESDGDRYLIHDLGSTNGTYVNGQPVSSAILRHGDTVSIGNAVLRFLMIKPEDDKKH